MSEEKIKKDAKVVVKKKETKENKYSQGLYYYGTGRRKNCIARVIIKPGEGKWTVNDLDPDAYFDHRKVLLLQIEKPFKVTNLEKKYNVQAHVLGGGKSGQAGALAHGIARAIIVANPELKKVLKIEGLITRDPRVKEAKKYGRKKARKGFTYRKR